MTRLLAGVTGPTEAVLACDAGADIIELADPAGGPPSLELLQATLRALAGNCPLGAVAGAAPAGLAAAAVLAAAGLDYVCLALPARPDFAADLAPLADLVGRTRLIAALPADRAPHPALLRALAASGLHAVLLDAAGGEGGRLLDHLDLPTLAGFVAAAQSAGLRAGLAGGLEAPDIPRLLLLAPDLLGWHTVRRSGFPTAALRRIRALIPAEDNAALNMPHRPEADPPATDRIFVRDFILPVRIGAYAAEHAAPQRVRFDVDAWVTRPARPPREMADIVSYDLITDGIRLLVAAGHFQLVETLAERIADAVLAHPRLLRTRVRITKLDTGSGALGVEIERRRDPAAAPLARPLRR
jgi:dihydroneopterin aldolase